MSACFGFKAYSEDYYDDDLEEVRGYVVELPHSCDNWKIANLEKTPEEALAKLRAFIAEATALLESLERDGFHSEEW